MLRSSIRVTMALIFINLEMDIIMRLLTLMQKKIYLLTEEHSVQETYDLMIKESGGPNASPSQSTEPRNKRQLYNVNLKRLREESKPNDAGDVDNDLSRLLRDLRSMHVVQIIIDKKHCYFFYLSTKRKIEDFVKLCCTGQNTSVLGTDTTYNLCDMWVTDLCYQNKRLIRNYSGHHPVFLGPFLFHFTKDNQTFTRFTLELQASNPETRKLKKIGVGMEDPIFNGMQSLFPDVSKL